MILQFTRLVQGALRQERRFQITSNNLSNVDTPSFKEDVLSFDWKLRAHLTVNHSQGPIRETGNPLDVSLADEGFFTVQTPFGDRYTRDGRFTINSVGELVTQNGDPVLGENGPIAIEGNKVDINKAGEVFVDGQIVDALKVVTFEDLTPLFKQGGNLYEYLGDPGAEIAPPNIDVRQKTVEGSNVETVTEMARLIELSRMYETYQKMLQSFDETDAKAISDVGQLR